MLAKKSIHTHAPYPWGLGRNDLLDLKGVVGCVTE